MRFSERLAIGVIVVSALLLIGSCMKWRWEECRGVGHGVAYCVWDAGR